jgi:hypothetical protein
VTNGMGAKRRWRTWAPVLLAGAIAAAMASPAAAEVPHGKQVYKSDFAKGPPAEWQPNWTERTPIGNRAFLGQFGIEPVTFTLRSLPAHKFVRLHISLFMLEPVDGSSDRWGPDVWELRVLRGPRLMYTTFDTVGFSFPGPYPNGNDEQAFPDDYPWAIHKGGAGAAEERNLGFNFLWPDSNLQQDSSSVYDLTLVFPHEGADLRLLWQALWSERVKKGGESWGLESLEVEVLDGPQPLTQKQLEASWQDLAGEDAMKAFAALWTLVSGGEKSVAFVADQLSSAALPADPASELGRLIKALDDRNFQVREEATRRLHDTGRPYQIELRKIAETTESPEVRFRLQRLFEQWTGEPEPTVLERDRLKHDLLAGRAVRVLETIGGPEALKALEAAGAGEKPAVPLAAAARLRLAGRMLDELLARADAADLAGEAKAEELGAKALAFAKVHLPEDQRRVAATLEDWRLRQSIRAAAAPKDVDTLRAAVVRRLAVGDDPAGAAKLAAKLPDDPKLARALTLAAKAPEELSLEEAALLREFCLAEAKNQAADDRTKIGLTSRALALARPDDKPYEERFDPAKDIDEKLLVARADHEAERGRWTDVIDFMHLAATPSTFNFVPDSVWQREWHGAIAGGVLPVLTLPVKLDGSYQLRVQFSPVADSTLSIEVPIGGGHSVAVDIRDADGSLSAVRWSDQDQDRTTAKWSPRELTSGGEYTADVTVVREAGDKVSVRLDIDGRKIVEWRGATTDSARDGTSGKPVLAFRGSRILVRTLAVRMLDGHAAFGQ